MEIQLKIFFIILFIDNFFMHIFERVIAYLAQEMFDSCSKNNCDDKFNWNFLKFYLKFLQSFFKALVYLMQITANKNLHHRKFVELSRKQRNSDV